MRAKCTRCDKPFCDRCLAFTVNGTLFCEPCGHRAEDESKPQWAAGLVLGGGIFVASSLLFLVIAIGAGRVFPVLTAMAWTVSVLVGWNRASPLRGAERPVIVRRHG